MDLKPQGLSIRLSVAWWGFADVVVAPRGIGRELHHQVAPLPFSPPTRSSQHPPQPTPTPFPSAPTPFPTKEPTNQPTNQHQHQHPPAHLLPHPPQLQRPSKRAASDSGGKAATAGENRSRFCCLWRSGGRAWCVDPAKAHVLACTWVRLLALHLPHSLPHCLPHQAAQPAAQPAAQATPFPTPLPTPSAPKSPPSAVLLPTSDAKTRRSEPLTGPTEPPPSPHRLAKHPPHQQQPARHPPPHEVPLSCVQVPFLPLTSVLAVSWAHSGLPESS